MHDEADLKQTDSIPLNESNALCDYEKCQRSGDLQEIKCN